MPAGGIVLKFGVNRSTLYTRFGKKTEAYSEATTEAHLLFKEEEAQLVDWCARHSNAGSPLALRHLRQYINAIIRNHVNSHVHVGANYIGRFIKRHPAHKDPPRIS